MSMSLKKIKIELEILLTSNTKVDIIEMKMLHSIQDYSSNDLIHRYKILIHHQFQMYNKSQIPLKKENFKKILRNF